MRALTVFTIALLTGCAVPELEQREPQIRMAAAPASTNAAPVSSALPPTRVESAFGASSSPYHEYDQKIIKAIEKRWLELTPRIQMRGRGQVAVDFKLNPEGGVADVQVRPTRLLGIAVDICKQAILESAPFDPWPAEMRRALGERDREVTFTFNYR
jgi:hypothetical protein